MIIFCFLIAGCTYKPEGMTWQEYAVQKGDPSICDSASHPDVCRSGFTQATGDASACSKITDEVLRDTCYAYDRGGQATDKDRTTTAKTPEDCQYDSECPAICEGDVAWKQGCNAREGRCEKTFDTRCMDKVETFGPNSFPKVCSGGKCVRDQASIDKKREELIDQKDWLKQEMSAASERRASLIAVKDEANSNCLGGLSDATVILMNEFATKTAGIIAGGVSVVQGASSHVVSWTTPVPDYINKGLDEAKGKDEQKLTLDEYIKLNCHLDEYFGHLLDESDAYIDELTAEAREVDAEYDALP